MHLNTKYFPGFHHRLFGRKPVSRERKLARMAREADSLCLTQLRTLFEDVLPSWLAAFKTARGSNSRHCTYTTLVSFWAFLSQVLDPDGSCRRAVTRVQTLCSALGLALPDEDTGAYCVARSRLPIRVLFKVFYFIGQRLSALPRDGRRIVVMDGTSIRMPDSPQNAAAYSHTPGSKPGCGFPLMQLLGLFDLATGAWLATIKSKTKAHDARLAWKMLKHLRKDGILLADRAFCSYAFIVACQARGVDVVMRLHQKRDPQLDKGRRIGTNDWHVTWSRAAPMAQQTMPLTPLDALFQCHSTLTPFSHQARTISTYRCNNMAGTRFRIVLIVAGTLTCFARVQCEEPLKEPDLTASKNFGIARRMVTVLPDEALLRNLRETDYAKMTLDDPLPQSAYVHVFKNARDIVTGSGLRPELLAALNDLKRRGNDVTPVLLKLMKENPCSPFECAGLKAAYIETMNPGPFLECAREALKTRWDTLQAADVGGIAYMLLHKGIPSDVELLREAVKKRPCLTDQIESKIAAAKRPGGPLAERTEPTALEHTDVKKRDAVKPTASPPPIANTSSTNWLIWLLVVIAATIGAAHGCFFAKGADACWQRHTHTDSPFAAGSRLRGKGQATILDRIDSTGRDDPCPAVSGSSSQVPMIIGSWPLANELMFASLKYMKYDVEFVQGEGAHNSRHAGSIFPEAMKWLWRGWQDSTD